MSNEHLNYIDISKLPEPDLVGDINPDVLLKELVDEISKDVPEVDMSPSEPLYRALSVVAYKLSSYLQRTNDAVRQGMVAFARDENLESLVLNADIQRKTDEKDFELRERYLESFEMLTTAGSKAGYVAHAKKGEEIYIADLKINDVENNIIEKLKVLKDVHCSSEENSSVIDVSILPIDEIQSDFIIEAIEVSTKFKEEPYEKKAREDENKKRKFISNLRKHGPELRNRLLKSIGDVLNNSRIRPLCDRVKPSLCEYESYEIDVRIILFDLAKPVVLASAKESLSAYLRGSQRIGLKLPLSGISASLHLEGVSQVEVTAYHSVGDKRVKVEGFSMDCPSNKAIRVKVNYLEDEN